MRHTHPLSDATLDDWLGGLVARRRDYCGEVRSLADEYPSVVFYGCGSMFHDVLETWRTVIRRPVTWCCDSDSRKWGRSFEGVRCLSLDELRAIRDECVVFVMIDESQEVFEFLKAESFPSVHPFFLFDTVASEYLIAADGDELVGHLRRTYQMLADETSRAVFAAIVERVFGDGSNPHIMASVRETDQYFAPDIVRLTRDEAFVDVGAFTGDTLSDFVTRTSGRFERFDAFEMDPSNFAVMSAAVAELPAEQRDRIRLFDFGLWDEDAEIRFASDTASSRIGEGPSTGRVRPLDEVLDQEPVTFIKMDVEGAEPRALHGAARTIERCRPTMAICIYHDLRHLWQVPQYLRQLVPGYRIYLRQYTSIERETVCYALAPGED